MSSNVWDIFMSNVKLIVKQTELFMQMYNFA